MRFVKLFQTIYAIMMIIIVMHADGAGTKSSLAYAIGEKQAIFRFGKA